MPLLNSLKNLFLDLVFPVRCLGCKAFSDQYLCDDCEKTIKFNNEFFCIFCNARSSYRQICLKCLNNHAPDQCLSSVSYKQPAVNLMVSSLKYSFVKDVSKSMGKFLTIYLGILQQRGLIDFDPSKICVMPVPLHSRRLRWRSFNQSELLAKEVADYFKIKMYKNILTRVKNNKPQAQIESKKERQKNIKNCFLCKKSKNIKEKTILLVDDLVTTGSTLNECAKVLKFAGAKTVIGLTFARG